MWKIKNSLNNEILKYFIIFSIIILSFLWLFQALFFKTLYKEQRLNDIENVANKLEKNQTNYNFQEKINNLALDSSVCIEITDNNYYTVYNSTYFGKGCIRGKDITQEYKFKFKNSQDQRHIYELTNKEHDIDTLVYAIKLNNNTAYISTNINPDKNIEKLIIRQLSIITIILIILSFILAYYMSNKISKPINEISKEAKKIANGNFNIELNTNNNILEINELKETLLFAKEELNKTEEYRRDLMANVSHDLKTPLTMIKAYAEMSIDLHAKNKEKQKEDINTIVNEVDRLTLLVNDILTLSKMQSNIEELNKEEFDLIELTKDILDKYKVLVETENYNFIFNHNKDKIQIFADKQKLEQVLYNLINNAINYTGKDNKIEINIEETKNEIKIKIIDTGKGIKQEDIKYIWNKYYKNKKKHKRNLVGTGLGLSIVKNILELHNYKYGVESIENKGTTFYFIISKEKDEK